MTKIAIYTRLSRDDTGTQTATKRQEKACRQFADLRGWTVHDVYEDVDVSAYQPRVVRPAYDRMLAAVRAGEIDGVLVWKMDRLVRRPAEFERFWALCEAHHVAFASATEPIDSSNEMGLALLRVLVTFASLESATISLRLKAKRRADAEAGKPPGGGPRPYGHTRDLRRLVKSEAATIQLIVKLLLEDWPIKRIIRELHRREIPSPTGRPYWHNGGMKAMLLSPRLVGDRSHNGEVVATDCYPAIIDRMTHARVRAILADRTTRQARRHGTDFLLNRIIYCSRCGNRLYPHRNPDNYRCTHLSDVPDVSISSEYVESWATEAVFWRLRRREAQPRRGPTNADAEARLLALERHRASMLELARDYYNHRVISRDEYLVSRFALDQSLAEATREETNLPSADEAEARWGEMTLEERRGVITSELRFLVINPSARRGMRSYATRVKAAWWQPFGRGGEIPKRLRTAPLLIKASTTERVLTPAMIAATETVTVSQAASRIGVPDQHVRNLIRDGALRARGGRQPFLIARRDLDAYLRAPISESP
jgi:site-specific DNA recombinase